MDIRNMKPILLAADDNYIKPLIAQINSIYRNFNGEDIKIYLVHNLSDKNLHYIEGYIHAQERFRSGEWEYVKPGQGSHVTKTDMAKYQVESIKEPNFFYMDTDVVVNRNFAFEYPDTMTCDGGKEDLTSDKPYLESMKLMVEFIKHNNGLIEEGEYFMLFADGVYFGNRDWIVKALRPVIKYCSLHLPQAERHWTGMGFFQAAIGLLQRPINLFKLKEFIFFRSEPNINLDEYDLIHYIGGEKPWNYEQGKFPLPAGEVWWDYYLHGPIKPI
jgi:hypothetical protein